MNEKKYLVYVDILGFERLAEEIEEERGIESREVREKFIDVINERVKTIERRGRITGKKYGERAQSKNQVIYHREERRVRRVLRLFQSLPMFFGTSAFSVCSAVKFKDIAISLEN